MSKGGYLASVSVGGLLLASAVVGASQAADTPAPPASSAAPGAADASGQVIVTATRRRENIQKVPASVTSISGAQLAVLGVTTTSDLTASVPGLTFARSTAVAQPTIRGIGSRDATTGAEGNVAIYLDGVYQAHPFDNVFELSDIQQIQVLKGPQGTLYGRNAAGGAIVVTTRSPTFTPTGTVSLNYGSDNLRRGDLFLSGPIIGDKVAASLSVSGLAEDGYIKNLFLHKEDGATTYDNARFKLLYNVTSTFQLGLSIYGGSANDNAILSWHPFNGNTIARTLPNTLNLPLNVRVPQGTYETTSYFDTVQTRDNSGINLNAKWDLGWADWSTVAAFDRSDGDTAYDNGATVVHVTPVYGIHFYSKSYWVETNLASKNDSRFTWLVGGNFFSDLSQTRPQQNSIPEITADYGVDTPSAVSAYAQGTYAVLDDLFLTVGARASNETKDGFYDRLAPTRIYAGGHGEWSAFTPSATIRYQPTSDINLYASYNRGFKSGTFDATTVTGAEVPARPETIDAFEAGVKATVLSKLQVDLAAFHYIYHNLQVSSVVTTGAGTVSELNNAAQAQVDGAEADFNYHPIPEVGLSADFSLLDTRFTKFQNAVVIVQKPLVGGLGVGNMNAIEDLTGNQLVRAPKYTANFTVTDEAHVFGGVLETTASYFLSAKYYQDVNNRTFQPAYGTLNASAVLKFPDGIALSLSGTNLTSAKVELGFYASANADLIAYARPAEVIGGISYSF